MLAGASGGALGLCLSVKQETKHNVLSDVLWQCQLHLLLNSLYVMRVYFNVSFMSQVHKQLTIPILPFSISFDLLIERDICQSRLK